MKTVTVIAISAICVLQACGNGKSDNSVADSISSADSLNALKDTAKKAVVIEDNADIQFAAEAASGGLTEVELGRLALQRGRNKRVKNFGAMMVKDHTKANDKLLALAKIKNISLPVAPDAQDQKVIDELRKKSGEDFDRAYVNDMIEDHTNDIKAFESASKNLSDPDIKKFAIKTLPVLKNHLDAINVIHDSMK